MTQVKTEEVNRLVDHLFRNKAGQITAVLIRIFGIDHLSLIEDVVQDTLVKAIQHWPFAGIPDNPGGWLLQTARNRALDLLRRETVFRNKQADIASQLELRMAARTIGQKFEFEDEQLTLMFTCCHSALTQENQIALILKTLCAFSVEEISRAFLTQPATIAQRLVRAKRKLKDVRFEIPEGKALETRLSTVLAVLYLLFNEGYSATQGSELIREDFCHEAIRLATLLSEHPAGDHPSTHALLALMFFQASRLSTRTDSDGNLLLLQQQNRAEWDQGLIQRGFYYLEQAMRGKELSEYHIQAGIAACHVAGESYKTTDWKQILDLYDLLIELDRSPVFLLNRTVALAMVHGAKAGLRELTELSRLPSLKNYYLLPATFAEFYRRLGEYNTAADYYNQTLELIRTKPERDFILQKLSEISHTDFH